MKKKLFAIGLIVAVLALLSVGTLAYYAVQRQATIAVTTGNVKIALHETRADGSDFPAEGVTVLPGDVVDKVVTMENVGSHPLYLRVKLEKTIDDEMLTVENCIQMDINTEAWTYHKGYYYYNEKLEPGMVTEPLYSTVSFSATEMDNRYLGKQFNVKVAAWAVQSENNSDSPFTAAGWEEE